MAGFQRCFVRQLRTKKARYDGRSGMMHTWGAPTLTLTATIRQTSPTAPRRTGAKGCSEPFALMGSARRISRSSASTLCPRRASSTSIGGRARRETHHLPTAAETSWPNFRALTWMVTSIWRLGLSTASTTNEECRPTLSRAQSLGLRPSVRQLSSSLRLVTYQRHQRLGCPVRDQQPSARAVMKAGAIRSGR
jgi:hypothetical protein